MFLLRDTYWCIQKTKEKGRGVFAKQHIPKGTIIGDYLGKIIHIADYNPDYEKGMYLMSFADDAFIYPDLSVPGIYLLNHACRPNCWMYVYRGHTLFFALFDIEPGEELTVSYLLSPRDESCKSLCLHVCKCKSTFCTGTMHLSSTAYKRWHLFQKNEKKKTRLRKYTAGEYLPKLTTYPKMTPDNPIYKQIYTRV